MSPYSQNQNSQQKRYPINLPLWILIGFFILAVVATVLLFTFSQNKNNEKETSPNKVNNFSKNASLINCNTNWNCFISASKNCSKANLTNTSTIDFFGMDITTKSYYEILGQQDNKCSLKLGVLEQHVNYSNEVRKQLLANGNTTEQINQQEQKANDAAKLLWGKEGICESNLSNLSIYFSKVKTGDLSGGVSCSLSPTGENCTYTGDWALLGNCHGDLFSSQLSQPGQEF